MNQFNVSLWGDEAFSAILSQKSIPDIIKTISHDTSPPLYNILEHLWFGTFGNSEVSIRSLSFIFFLVAVLFVYKIGHDFWDQRTGAIAALLTFLNPFFFNYAFEGRMYSLLAATVTGSFYFFLKKKWLPYILLTTAALYTHHFAIFAIFVQGLWFIKKYLFDHEKDVINNLYAFIAVAVLYIPWLIPLYNQIKMVGGGFWLGKPNVKDFFALILVYLNISLIALALRKWTKDFGKNSFFILWFLIPIVTAWVISQKFSSIFFDRYLLYTIPAAMLLVSSQRRELSKAAIAIIIASFLVFDVFYFTHPIKEPFRDLAGYVLETKKGDDYLINWNSSSHHLWEAKYYGIPAPLYLPGNTNLPFFVGTALMTKDDFITKIPKNINRVGVITSGSVDEIVLTGYTKNDIKTFGNLKFIWYGR